MRSWLVLFMSLLFIYSVPLKAALDFRDIRTSIQTRYKMTTNDVGRLGKGLLTRLYGPNTESVLATKENFSLLIPCGRVKELGILRSDSQLNEWSTIQKLRRVLPLDSLQILSNGPRDAEGYFQLMCHVQVNALISSMLELIRQEEDWSVDLWGQADFQKVPSLESYFLAREEFCRLIME